MFYSWCTKMSSLLSFQLMNSYWFFTLTHFTVPGTFVTITFSSPPACSSPVKGGRMQGAKRLQERSANLWDKKYVRVTEHHATGVLITTASLNRAATKQTWKSKDKRPKVNSGLCSTLPHAAAQAALNLQTTKRTGLLPKVNKPWFSHLARIDEYEIHPREKNARLELKTQWGLLMYLFIYLIFAI